MTRLLDPGLGEFLDRHIVLDLKLEHYPKVRHPPFIKELRLIEQRLMEHWHDIPPRHVRDEWKALHTTNQHLWQAEDEMRRYRMQQRPLGDGELVPVAHCGIRMQQLNDERARLIALINEKDGHPHDDKARE